MKRRGATISDHSANVETLPSGMVPVDLKRHLRRLGSARLSVLVGAERLEAIDELFGRGVNEGKMVELLLLRHGSQILADRAIRLDAVNALTVPYKGYILDGTFDPSHTLQQSEMERLRTLQWGRTRAASKRTIAIFGLPPEYLPQKYEPPPAMETINPEVYLYPYQRLLKDRAIRLLADGRQRLLIHMPTGSGKTRTVSEVIVDFLRGYADRSGFVVWLAHSEELCEQAVETIKKIWGARGDSEICIYRLWGDHPNPTFTEEGGVIVASLQRIHAMQTTGTNEVFSLINAIRSSCRLVVVDEAHKAIAPTYKAGIDFLCDIDRTKLIGLTATPGRGIDSAENRELVNYFAQSKITISDDAGNDLDNPVGYLQEEHFLARISRRRVVTDITIDLTPQERAFVETFLELPKSVLARLADNAARNACILTEIIGLHTQNKNVIVFACSVEHAHLICDLCMLRGIKARCIDGGTSSYDRSKWIQEYKDGKFRVLINYGVLTTGFDAPNTNAILITRPTGSIVLYSQMIGRGIRGPRMGGNEECLLVDLEDNLSGFPREQQAFCFFDQEWG